MKFADELIKMICCPESRQALKLVDDKTLVELNQLQASQKLCFVSGEQVYYPLSAALIREDQKIIYPVRSNIPVLLVQEGIDASQLQEFSS